MEKPRKWKTTTGAALLALGGALVASAQAMGPLGIEASTLTAWFMVAGIFCTTAGTSLMGVGLAHRTEKAANGEI
jgi:hypothetical protein